MIVPIQLCHKVMKACLLQFSHHILQPSFQSVHMLLCLVQLVTRVGHLIYLDLETRIHFPYVTKETTFG